MFGNKKEQDVDDLLAEGSAFVAKLDDCVNCTREKAEKVQEEINTLEAKRYELDLKVKRGNIVSKRISSVLTVTDEDLAKVD